MKTPNLYRLLARWKRDGVAFDDEEVNVLCLTVAEDIRDECEKAWWDGWDKGWEHVRMRNPYAKREDGR